MEGAGDPGGGYSTDLVKRCFYILHFFMWLGIKEGRITDSELATVLIGGILSAFYI